MSDDAQTRAEAVAQIARAAREMLALSRSALFTPQEIETLRKLAAWDQPGEAQPAARPKRPPIHER